MKLKTFLMIGLVIALSMTTAPLLAMTMNHQSADFNPIVKSAENGQVKLTVNVNPGMSTVGHLTKFTGQIVDKATGQPVTNVLVKINAHHMEEDKNVLHTEFVSTDGGFGFDNMFADGAEHLLTFMIEPTATSSIKFTPVGTEFPVEVMGVQPPTGVKVKTMIFLMVVIAFGMVAGVITPKSLKSRQSKRLITAPDSNT
ncbi:hypothetical protein JCM15765_43760 [Paradesulfitobacterium aromaticivorans]